MKTKVFLSIVLVIIVSATTLAQKNEKRFGFELSSGYSGEFHPHISTKKLKNGGKNNFQYKLKNINY